MIFLSHYQAETSKQTWWAMEKFEQRWAQENSDASQLECIYFVDCFSIRQGVKGDFQPDRVQAIIQKIGKTLMIAFPWKRPETLSRIWCVFELLCTVESEVDLAVSIIDDDDIV